jgi:glutamate/tyrosine decarboxylase-like PLP-dependent enzyme
VDPLHAIADFTSKEKLWLHTDSAYAGFSVLTERGRRLLDGLGRADSLTLDPHKWLYVPFECGCLLARDPRALELAFSVHPEYLQDVRARDAEVNFADYGEQLTRYSRAIKVWISVRYFGTDAIRDAIDRGVELARRLEQRVRETPPLEVVSPAQFGVVCFRVRPGGMSEGGALDALNERVLTRVVGEGRYFISSTRLRGAFLLRACILGYRTAEEDVDGLVRTVAAAAREVLAPAGAPA